jgi:hypothetical protein
MECSPVPYKLYVCVCVENRNLQVHKCDFGVCTFCPYLPPAEGRRDRSAKLEFSVDRRFHAREMYL